MTGETEATRPALRRAGWIMSGLVVVFLTFDVGIKLIRHPMVGQTLAQLGWRPDMDLAIGVIEAICLVLYVVPQTAVLGAILWTGVLGGAVATHLRLDDPLFSHTLFGLYLGLMVWGGLWLRDPRVRQVMPFLD